MPVGDNKTVAVQLAIKRKLHATLRELAFVEAAYKQATLQNIASQPPTSYAKSKAQNVKRHFDAVDLPRNQARHNHIGDLAWPSGLLASARAARRYYRP